MRAFEPVPHVVHLNFIGEIVLANILVVIIVWEVDHHLHVLMLYGLSALSNSAVALSWRVACDRVRGHAFTCGEQTSIWQSSRSYRNRNCRCSFTTLIGMLTKHGVVAKWMMHWRRLQLVVYMEGVAVSENTWICALHKDCNDIYSSACFPFL